MNTLLQFFAQQKITIDKGDLNLSDAPDKLDAPQIEAILMTVYFWAGIVAVIIIIIGGIRYVTSSGDASGVKSAKDTVLYAIVGLIVIIMAAAITGFIIRNIA